MKGVTIERRKGYYGMVRSLEIIADGQKVGSLGQGQAEVFRVPDECGEIWGKMDWGETPRLVVSTIGSNDTVVFKPQFTLNLLKNLGASELPFKVFVDAKGTVSNPA